MIPTPLAFALLALAAFRIFRLLGRDDLPPLPEWRNKAVGAEEVGGIWTFRRPTLAHWLQCPYCLGFHVSWVLYGLYWWQPRWSLVAVAPFAINAVVVAWSRVFDPE